MVGGGTALAIDRVVLGIGARADRRSAPGRLHGNARVASRRRAGAGGRDRKRRPDGDRGLDDVCELAAVLGQDGLVRACSCSTARRSWPPSARIAKNADLVMWRRVVAGIGSELSIMATDSVDGRMADGCRVSCASRRVFLTRIPGVVLAAMVGVDRGGGRRDVRRRRK